MNGMSSYRRRLMAGAYPKEMPNYLCFTALESGTFTFRIGSSISTTIVVYVKYSTDGGATWVTTQNVANTEVTITTPTISEGGTVLWRGSAITYGDTYLVTRTESYCNFSSTGAFEASGCFMSLLYDDAFSDVSASRGNYMAFGMFYQSKIVNCSIDFGINTHQHSFRNTFSYCANLISAADILFKGYASAYTMTECFRGCTSLKSIPDLSHMTINSNYGADRMFYDCVALEDAIINNYTTSSYFGEGMFVGCAALKRLCISNSMSGFSANLSTNSSRAAISLCTSLARVILPKVTVVGALYTANDAGRNALEMMDWGPTVTMVGSNDQKTNSNTILVCRATTPPSFNILTSLTVGRVYVPSSALSSYQSSTVWATASLYAIGGAEWIAEFGSSDEYANLTNEEKLINYPNE